MAGTNNTKHDEDQKEYENQNNHIRKLRRDTKTKTNKFKAL